MRNTEKKIWYQDNPLLGWVLDIEITKAPYLITLAIMSVSVILYFCPFASISAPYMETMKFTLLEVDEISAYAIAGIILNIVSLGAILIPIGWFYEWKCKWFVFPIICALYDSGLVMYFNGKRNELLKNSMLGYIYDYLSIDLELTLAAWLLFVLAIVALLCGIKMFIDVKNNKRFYQL